MAELTPFSYRPGASVLHQQDVRFKLVFIVAISLAGMKAYFMSLSVLSFALFAAILIIHLPLKSILKELRYFFIFLIFVFAARALCTSGTPLIEFMGIDITREGIYNGTLVCWRLLLVVLVGLLFISTTKLSEIRAAVEWFLSPFPFIPGKRVATMMSLIIRFIPVILKQAKETSDAQRARGVENRKNPVYRLMKLAVPLVRRTFENADKLAVAMEARCYTEKRVNIELYATRNDWIAFFLVLCLCVLLSVIDMFGCLY